LTIGRAGRASSRGTLAAARAALEARGRPDEASAVDLAMELLETRPPSSIERADRGYRRVDAARDVELFVDDPLAAHWHLVHRWGPPLRPDPDATTVEARADADVEELVREAREGKIVVVPFAPEGRLLHTPEAPLLVVRAGFARDRAFGDLVRWSELASIGIVERRGARHVGWERYGARVERFGARPSLPVEGLLHLLTRMLELARP
ncbi:hypothetical protein L6R52_43515, partial [Myxococcota bacterium]|nr:hypothetical protein [Myxococcota bacterium]